MYPVKQGNDSGFDCSGEVLIKSVIPAFAGMICSKCPWCRNIMHKVRLH
jgi:hypothetical protein